MKSKKLLAVLSATAMVASVAPTASVFAASAGSVVALSNPFVTTASTTLGSVKVSIPAGSQISGQKLILSLSQGKFADYTAAGGAGAPFAGAANKIELGAGFVTAGDVTAKFLSSSKIEIDFNAQAQTDLTTADGTFYVRLGNIDLSGATAGAVNAVLDASANSGLPTGSVQVGTLESSGTVAETVANTTTSNGSFTFDLGYREPYAGVIPAGASTITLKLPNGYVWDTNVVGKSITNTYGSAVLTYDAAPSDNTLVITLHRTGTTDDVYFPITGLQFHVSDPSLVKAGDIVAQVKTSFTSDQSTLKVGTYGDYGVTTSAASVKSFTSGYSAQALDNLEVKEAIPGSLNVNRTVTLTLPQGVEWVNGVNPTVVDQNGTALTLTGIGATKANQQTLTFTVGGTTTDATSGPADFLIKGLKVQTAPDFNGDINVQVGGNAGVTGTVKVATSKPAVTVSVDKPSDIKLGLTGQTLGTITLKENAVGALAGGNDGGTKTVHLTFSDAVQFDGTPTVTVTDGDLAITNVAVNGSDLSFDVKSGSISKASTIQITGAKVKSYRTLPQEDINLDVTGSAVEDTSYTVADFPNDLKAATVKVGQIVTPADQSVKNVATFVIGQSSYNVNGNNVSMDVAPYIKNDRTYLPVHFVADALGVPDNSTVWDGSSQTVTIFAQGKVIQLKIGSKVMTVNGAPITMDTAPEIVNGRTMLPVSFVATALGYTATWDGTTQTVTIQ